MSAHTVAVLADVEGERRRQDALWGTTHDDEHTILEFVAITVEHLGRAVSAHDAGQAREQFVRTAALAVAAVEAIDRRSGSVA